MFKKIKEQRKLKQNNIYLNKSELSQRKKIENEKLNGKSIKYFSLCNIYSQGIFSDILYFVFNIF